MRNKKQYWLTLLLTTPLSTALDTKNSLSFSLNTDQNSKSFVEYFDDDEIDFEFESRIRRQIMSLTDDEDATEASGENPSGEEPIDLAPQTTESIPDVKPVLITDSRTDAIIYENEASGADDEDEIIIPSLKTIAEYTTSKPTTTLMTTTEEVLQTTKFEPHDQTTESEPIPETVEPEPVPETVAYTTESEPVPETTPVNTFDKSKACIDGDCPPEKEETGIKSSKF